MAIDERKFKRLKLAAEGAKTERDKAAGQLESVKQRLEDEFDCSTVEKAEELLAGLNKEAAEAEAVYNQNVADFEEVWEEKLVK